MMSEFDPDVRFAKAIVRLLKYFNLLDTNVGLCLSFLITPSDPQASYERLGNLTAQQRFEELRRFVAQGVGFPTTVDLHAFEEWLSEASRAKAIRNRYVHANWEYLPGQAERPVVVRAPPWMRPKLGDQAEQTMSLDELDAVADDMARIFDRFRDIRRKHGI